ncbi:fibrous sheath CABYR-binding protein [Equus quagga]|uniref:fibrous sheath CABYR-binding protein n=1 Tax=Equus quagga TaxID=89248 RepID=UPI001EE282F6|nr:fibrous sheath CABYR-binding protein [Equus quagga]
MEESDEPDQPISSGRQEIRKRRRPSRPMVDKAQQTEELEKKKHSPMPQSSGPKATLSIGNIHGSKVNYESLRVSSQLQQTWVKRKRVQDMTDKSLQTDPIAEEKKEEIKSVGETVIPDEKPAAVGEAAPEFPESVHEVEISPSRPAVQLKIDRSQQTSCTGDWTMMNIPQREKVDKEQQTYFSESEIVVICRPGSSFPNSKQDEQTPKSSGKVFAGEHPEFQPTTCSSEEIRQKSISRSSFSQQNIKSTPVLLEDEQDVLVEVQPPTAEEISPEVQPPPAEEITAEETPADLQPPPAEEAPTEQALSEEPYAEVQPPTAEEAPVEIQPSPAEEAPTQEAPELQLPPAVEAPAEEVLEELQPLPAEEAPAEEATAELQPPLVEETTAEEVPAKVQPPATEEVLAEEPLAELQPPPVEKSPAEEAPAEDQSPPAEEPPIEEASAEDQSPPTEEPPMEEAPAEDQSPPTQEPPMEEAPAEDQSPPAEEALAGEAPAEITAGETPAELLSPPAEEVPAEEAPAELQPPPTEETTSEMVPVDRQPPPAEEPNSISQISIKDTPAEVQPPPSQQTPTAEALVDNVSTEYQSPETTDVSVVKLGSLLLKDEPKYEEPLQLDPVPEDLSTNVKGQVSTIEIDGVIQIQVK